MSCVHPQFKINPEFKHCPDCGALSSLIPEDLTQFKLEELETTHGVFTHSPDTVVKDIRKIATRADVYIVKHHRMINRQKKAFFRYRLLKYLKKEYPRFVSRPRWKKAFEEPHEGILVLHEDFEEAFLHDYKVTEWNRVMGSPKKL